MKTKEIRYYSDFSDDFEQTAEQNFILPENYEWVKRDLFSRFLSAIVYFFAVVFSSVYCKLFLHMKIFGREKLKGIKGGFYVFGNHTQPIGDVFIPALCVLPKRIYTVVSTANYGIPVIGKILPYLGALPTVDSLSGIKKLTKAMEYRLNKGNPIVIFPEAHVWEYYTDIRPFPDTSFKYPVKFGCPSFAVTVTYKESRLFKKPVMEAIIDGPFFGNGDTAKEKAEDLHNKIFGIMKKRSENGNCEYIKYIKK